MAFMEGDSSDTGGTPIARPGDMARRLVAFVTMVAIIAVALAVMWRVYRHHVSTVPHVEPTIVELRCVSPLNS
jgi:hypothetical protein